MKTIKMKHHYTIGIAACMLLLTSCVSMNKVKILQGEATDQEFTNNKKQEYHIQVGDDLYIKVFSVDDKTSKLFQSHFPTHYSNVYKNLNSYKVDKNGYIHFSFIEKMKVKGKTIEGVRDLIQNKINEYFKEATVIVKLINFRVSILGEAQNPGSFIVDNRQMNILEAISKAGGFTNFANRNKITLVRQTVNGSKVHHIDISNTDILTSDYYYLMPNDIVYIEPLNSKTWAFDNFPYQLFLSALSTFAIIFSVLN